MWLADIGNSNWIWIPHLGRHVFVAIEYAMILVDCTELARLFDLLNPSSLKMYLPCCWRTLRQRYLPIITKPMSHCFPVAMAMSYAKRLISGWAKPYKWGCLHCVDIVMNFKFNFQWQRRRGTNPNLPMCSYKGVKMSANRTTAAGQYAYAYLAGRRLAPTVLFFYK